MDNKPTGEIAFGSSSFVVNDRLYIAGGKNFLDDNGIPKREPSGVYVYDDLKRHVVCCGAKPYPLKQAWCSGDRGEGFIHHQQIFQSTAALESHQGRCIPFV